MLLPRLFSQMRTRRCMWPSRWPKCPQTRRPSHKWSRLTSHLWTRNKTRASAWSLRTLLALSRTRFRIWTSHASRKWLASTSWSATSSSSRISASCWRTTMRSWPISESTRCYLSWWAKSFTSARSTLVQSKYTALIAQRPWKLNWIPLQLRRSSLWGTDRITLYAWAGHSRMRRISARTLFKRSDKPWPMQLCMMK